MECNQHVEFLNVKPLGT